MVKKSKADNSLVNDFMLKELLKRGYSVEGKNKVYNIADSKLWYITSEQAQAFLDLEEHDPKQKMFVKKEVDLLKKEFKMLTSELTGKSFNIIDLGCGNGEKASIFVNQFKNKNQIRYCPIDISGFMVEKALKTLSKIKSLKIIKFKHNLLDFLDLDEVTSELRNGAFDNNFLLLLGGSLENSDVHELLHDIRVAMKDRDYLLIGNKLTHPNPEKMVNYYNQSKYISNLLFQTIKQLGFKKDEVQYGARFRGSRIEMYYLIKRIKQ